MIRKFGPLSRSKLSALGTFALFFSAATFAAPLTWDPLDNGGASVAGGDWDTTEAFWYNGATDTTWAQGSGTSATDGAIFGGADGAYKITNVTEIAFTNLAFLNSGYSFTNAASLSGPGLYGAAASSIVVAAGKMVTFNGQVSGPGNGAQYWELGDGAVVNLLGGGAAAQQPQFESTNGGATFYLSGNFPYSVIYVAATVYQTNGVVGPVNGGMNLGRPPSAGFPASAASTGTWIEAGTNTLLTTSGGSLNLARGGGQGTLIISNGAAFETLSSPTSGQNGNLGICVDNAAKEQGVLNVYGGTVNVGSQESSTGGVMEMVPAGASATTSAVLNQTGGVINAWGGIFFGENASAAYPAGSVASVTNSGGVLCIGNAGPNGGGINQGQYGPSAINIVFSGGAIGSLANWSSPMPITLGTLNGNITFLCADSNGAPHNVTLAGPLSGSGGLNVSGAGTLTLGGTNSYAGATVVSNGTLAMAGVSIGGGSYSLTGNSTLSVQLTGAESSLPMSSFSLAGGSTLNLAARSAGNPVSPMIEVSGALMPSNVVAVNVSGPALTNGQFTLIKYGALGGAGFGAFVLNSVSLPTGVSGSAQLVNNIANQSIDLTLTIYPAGQLVWNGTVNGDWDIGLTSNWQTNAFYTQTVTGGPVVVFDDTAAGPYTDIVLNTNVSPAEVVVSNAALNYSIAGSGGIGGAGGLVKEGSGTFTLGGSNTFNGGIEITGGTLALTTTNNAAMAYTNTGGILNVTTAPTPESLAMTSLTFGSNNPQLTFNLFGFAGLGIPAINDSGNLIMQGNVAVNVPQPIAGTNILLQYAGNRIGSGSFVVGSIPANASLIDNPAGKTVSLVYAPQPRVVVPTLNTNELIVAVATPQEYGAKGDGISDDSAAFQSAMNAVYHSGAPGGGVIFVPAANYAFYNNITIPQGVTLHGDWTDWTTGSNGLMGTTFSVYFGAGQSNGPPFIFMDSMSCLRGINFWYPNQNPTDITPYPFTIQISGDCVLKNLGLVNVYQGIVGTAVADAAEHVMSTIIGSPLCLGISVDMLADVSHTEDVRFSPSVWPASLLPNAPAAGGSYAAWMRAHGEGMRLLRVDGEMSIDTQISGYNVGIEANASTNGSPGATFYGGAATNCATALLAQQMPGQSGLQFTRFTLDGDLAVNRTVASNDATVQFDHCQIIGRQGTAVSATGADWHSWFSFQNCVISNTLQLAGPGVFSVVDSTLLGSPQCVMSASAIRAAFTGCSFGSPSNIVNQGGAGNLLVDARRSISNVLPVVCWSNVLNNYQSRRPAKTNLYVATAWGATGNGVADDTAAIQSALTAAGTNGGGIVYLPAGKYHLTNTLDVPGGVELRGAREMRGGDGQWTDGHAKASVLQPYGGQGATNGPVALALEANSGVVGVNFSYETQNTNCIPFPATIQGRGGNVYAIGIVCPNAYNYVDLDTYTCTNHFLYMVDGWQVNRGVCIGRGSSGIIIDGQGNQSYWAANNDSASVLSDETPAVNFAESNAQMYVLGNCTETMLEDFNITDNMFIHCVSEDGYGPQMTGIGTYCDGTVQAYVLDAAAPCQINVVNSPMAVFTTFTNDFTNLTVGVMSTTNFQGTARFFNSALFGGPKWDFVVNSGDVGFDQVHMLDHSFLGSEALGGVLHLVNSGAYISYNGTSNFPPYNVTFGPDAGVNGNVSEFIGCYAYNGNAYANVNKSNLANIWMDYALRTQSVLTLTNQYQESPPASPPLSIQLAPDEAGFTFQWPGHVGNYLLYYTPDLAEPEAWTLVTNSLLLSNGQWSITVPFGVNPSGFFRLQQ